MKIFLGRNMSPVNPPCDFLSLAAGTKRARSPRKLYLSNGCATASATLSESAVDFVKRLKIPRLAVQMAVIANRGSAVPASLLQHLTDGRVQTNKPLPGDPFARSKRV